MKLRGTKVAITGAGGFIGLRAAERARASGMEVRGLDRSPASVARCAALGIPCVRGDVTQADDLDRFLDGAEVVVHTAAHVAEGGAREAFAKINVGGTRATLSAARKAGVKRFLHLSSIMVYGFHHRDDIDEDAPLRGDGNPYNETKIESEQLALAAHGEGGLEVVVLRPGDVWGKGSLPWVERPLAMMRRGLFALPDGGHAPFNHLHVDNLCDAMGLTLERDVVGVAVHLTDGQRTTVREYFLRLAGLLGKKRLPSVPSRLFAASLRLVERGADALGVEPPVRASVLPFLQRPGWMDIGRARKLLGYRPRVSLDVGMEELDRALHPRALPGGSSASESSARSHASRPR